MLFWTSIAPFCENSSKLTAPLTSFVSITASLEYLVSIVNPIVLEPADILNDNFSVSPFLTILNLPPIVVEPWVIDNS